MHRLTTTLPAGVRRSIALLLLPQKSEIHGQLTALPGGFRRQPQLPPLYGIIVVADETTRSTDSRIARLAPLPFTHRLTTTLSGGVRRGKALLLLPQKSEIHGQLTTLPGGFRRQPQFPLLYGQITSLSGWVYAGACATDETT
jgi:hypothetical protein